MWRFQAVEGVYHARLRWHPIVGGLLCPARQWIAKRFRNEGAMTTTEIQTVPLRCDMAQELPRVYDSETGEQSDIRCDGLDNRDLIATYG